MRALLIEEFGTTPEVVTVPDPSPPPDGVVVEVAASGVCRSDWHAWLGHDTGVSLPHVPGHEFAGEVVAVGAEVRRFRAGDRVTVPFVAGCGVCAQCRSGNQQVCEHQEQPGFTYWGSFAQLVTVRNADVNLVTLPDGMDPAAAASLGCRFATAFRAVVDQGRVAPGEWVTVHGCGGVGLSAVMIAAAAGANVVAVDVDAAALRLAESLGAVAVVDRTRVDDVPAAVREHTRGGSDVSLDAVGHPVACADSIRGLRARGRHVQVGLLLAEHAETAVPMDRVVAHELEILGSHGMPAHRYGAMLAMVETGRLRPEALVGRTVDLHEAAAVLTTMDRGGGGGVTVITSF